MKKLLALSYKTGRAADAALIEAELAAVNGTATANTIMTGAFVANIAEAAEMHLDEHGVKKDLRPGARLVFRKKGPSAQSYGYAAITTRITLERTTAGWVLVAAERDAVRPRQAEHFSVEITDEALQYAVERTLAAFGRSPEGYDKTRKAALDAAIEDAAIGQLA